jgi:hypothetical protein
MANTEKAKPGGHLNTEMVFVLQELPKAANRAYLMQRFRSLRQRLQNPTPINATGHHRESRETVAHESGSPGPG